MLGDGFEIRSGGNHVIILPDQKKSGKHPNDSYLITGEVRDAQSGKLISSVTVLELNGKQVASSDGQGKFNIPLQGDPEFTRLLISKKNYRDTVITVSPAGGIHSVRLRALPQIEELEPLDASIPVEMENNGLFRTVVTEEQQLLSYNLPLYEQRLFQFSFLPVLGTNRNFSGLIENRISLNLLGGYSMGLRGFELGGLFNITRQDVRGAQIGGFMNITGAELYGLQFAGFMNNNMGAIHGMQAAGFYNLSLDSLNGVQMAGFFNMARNRVRGLQTAGFLNISGKELKGTQLAGFINISGRDATGAQIAGFMNQATGDMKGIQASGFLNLSTGSMKGAQISGGINVTVDTTYTVQIANLANFAGHIYGAQIGLLNIAGKVTGSQIGLINYCDTVTGLPLGLISIVKTGVHQLEISSSDASSLIVALKTGTPRLYNVLSAGMFDVQNPSLASFGYGVGAMTKQRRKIGFGAELVVSAVFNESFKAGIVPDFWGRLSPSVSYRPVKWLSIFAGPVAHAYLIDVSNQSGPHPENYIRDTYSFNAGSGSGSAWIGWQAGIRLF
ncbi:MAG: hypothetical protein R2850_04065 [Bacteroidia bacterium]